MDCVRAIPSRDALMLENKELTAISTDLFFSIPDRDDSSLLIRIFVSMVE